MSRILRIVILLAAMAAPKKRATVEKGWKNHVLGRIPEQGEKSFRDNEHPFRKNRKSVRIETGTGVHVEPKWIFNMDRNMRVLLGRSMIVDP